MNTYEMFWQKNHVYQTTIDFYSNSILSTFLSQRNNWRLFEAWKRGILQFPRGWSKTRKLGHKRGGGPKLIMHAGQMEMPAESWHISYMRLLWQNEREINLKRRLVVSIVFACIQITGDGGMCDGSIPRFQILNSTIT